MLNAATQSTPPIGEGSGAEIPGIGLFLAFLAFRASVRDGYALRWVSGQRMRRAPRKRSVSCLMTRERVKRKARVVSTKTSIPTFRAGVSPHFLHSRHVAGDALAPRWGLANSASCRCQSSLSTLPACGR
jgi:hypothetical protein